MTARAVFFMIILLCLSTVRADQLVDRADANGDGFVSLYELRAAHYADPEFNKRIEDDFAYYDRDGDGRISEAERLRKAVATDKNTKSEIEFANQAMIINRTDGSSSGRNTVITNVEPRPVQSSPSLNFDDLKGNTGTSGRARQRVDPGVETANNNLTESAQRTKNNDGASRTETWINQIDTDRSGGASIAELIASGDGAQWFRKEDFHAADSNGDGDLNATELARLISSLERRQR